MPYETNTHNSSSIKFAIGNEVSVNAIIGMSFIKGAQLKIDLVDDVVESNLLQMDPIKINYKRPSKHMPKNIDGFNMENIKFLNDNDRAMQGNILSCMAFLANNKVSNADKNVDNNSLGDDDSSGNE